MQCAVKNSEVFGEFSNANVKHSNFLQTSTRYVSTSGVGFRLRAVAPNSRYQPYIINYHHHHQQQQQKSNHNHHIQKLPSRTRTKSESSEYSHIQLPSDVAINLPVLTTILQQSINDNNNCKSDVKRSKSYENLMSVLSMENSQCSLPLPVNDIEDGIQNLTVD